MSANVLNADPSFGRVPLISKNKKKIIYGLYPQTVVSDQALVDELKKIPAPEKNGWYLREGKWYAKISAAAPYVGRNYAEFSNGARIIKGQEYWFECEPIEWRVLLIERFVVVVLSEKILDACPYHSGSLNRTIDGETIYPNNYEHSDIRAWLNDEFLVSAFSDSSAIFPTEADNSTISTLDKTNQYICPSTIDKVFLLSLSEALHPTYQLSGRVSRMATPTDYALARGSNWNPYAPRAMIWRLRTPFCKKPNEVMGIDDRGYWHYAVSDPSPGIRPAMKMDLNRCLPLKEPKKPKQ